MNALRTFFLLTITLALAGGCGAGRSQTDRPMSNDEQAMQLRRDAQWTESPIRVEQKAVAVVEGLSPLVHIFELGGPIRVMDQTTNSRLAAVDVPARTLVRIDERNGVTVGQQNVVPGPLPAGHRYAIFAEPTTPNTVRQGVGAPGDATSDGQR